MKELLVVAFAILFPFAGSSRAKEKLYTINILGTELYSEPKFNSEVVSLINVGQEIDVIEIISGREKKIIGENFVLKGRWIKTCFNDLIGYVFSSETSNKKPELILSHNQENQILLFGKKGDVKLHKEKRECGGGIQCDYSEEITTYEFCTYKWSSMDSCFDHYYNVKGLSLNEVYYQFISLYAQFSSDGKIEIPRFSGRDGNILHFMEDIGVSQDMKIVIGENGSFEMFSSDCT